MVCENDKLVAAAGADGGSAHVVSVKLANVIYQNIEFFGIGGGFEVALTPLLQAALWPWWIVHLVVTVICDLGGFLWGHVSTWTHWRR